MLTPLDSTKAALVMHLFRQMHSDPIHKHKEDEPEEDGRHRKDYEEF
jgi:hypothetical protein